MFMSELMEYLFEGFKKDLVGGNVVPTTPNLLFIDGSKNIDISLVETFVQWSRKKLLANPPVSVMPLVYGLGLRLTDTSEVAIVTQPDAQRVRESIPITNPVFNPVTHGVSSIDSEPVFGRESQPKK